jgi:2-polyprenyl-6-methoxyphenol hydroxylase and related FAD-dependent oxidoreductases
VTLTQLIALVSNDGTNFFLALVCNPFGGLGLTGGIVDVGGLSDCLEGIYTGRAEDGILDIYDTVRREKYNEIIDPVSTGNIRLLFEQDPELPH